jgi:hypothetical protein
VGVSEIGDAFTLLIFFIFLKEESIANLLYSNIIETQRTSILKVTQISFAGIWGVKPILAHPNV